MTSSESPINIILVLCSQGRLDDALELYGKVFHSKRWLAKVSTSFDASTSSLAPLMDLCIKRGEPRLALDIFYDILGDSRMVLNRVVVNCALNACCKLRDPTRAKEIFDDIVCTRVELGIYPDALMFSILDAICRENKCARWAATIDAMKQLFKKRNNSRYGKASVSSPPSLNDCLSMANDDHQHHPEACEV